MDSHDLIRMANQIASFFRPYPPHEAHREIAHHIAQFWEPRMRQRLTAHLAAGGAGLDPLVLEAMRDNPPH